MFRTMRRHKQELDRTVCEEILDKAGRATLSVMGEDGYPYGVPVNFCYADGALWFHGAREGHKVDALRANDKACLTVLDEGVRHEGEWWWTVQSVICFGRMSFVEDAAEVERALRALADKYFPADYDTEADIAKNAGRVQILKMTIDHMSGKVVREK